MKGLWTFPQNGLGTVSIGTLHVLADFDLVSNNKGVLYVYSPGNGLSAYEITDNTDASVINIVADEDAPEEYFNLQGMKVNKPSSGVFIKRKGDKVSKVISK